MLEPVRCTFLVENGKIWYDLVAKRRLKTGSFSNEPFRLDGNTISKSIRLSKPSPVILSHLANNHRRINRSATPRFSGPTKPEEVGPTLTGDVLSKPFRFSMAVASSVERLD